MNSLGLGLSHQCDSHPLRRSLHRGRCWQKFFQQPLSRRLTWLFSSQAICTKKEGGRKEGTMDRRWKWKKWAERKHNNESKQEREGGREKRGRRKGGGEGEERKEEVFPPHTHGGLSQWPSGHDGRSQSREPEAFRWLSRWGQDMLQNTWCSA